MVSKCYSQIIKAIGILVPIDPFECNIAEFIHAQYGIRKPLTRSIGEGYLTSDGNPFAFGSIL